MLHLLQMVYLKCSLLSFSRFQTLCRSPGSALPASLVFLEIPHPPTLTSSSDSSSLYTSAVLLGPSGPSANAALSTHPCFQFFYPPSPSVSSSPPRVPGCSSTFPASSSPLTPLGFFNGMLEVSELGALNYYTLFCLILLT